MNAHTLGQLYESKTGNHQGLIIEEGTGKNVAVVYDKDHAAFIVRACNSHEAMLEALNHCEKVFRSMADRGAYPQELLPFDMLEQDKESALYLGVQGFNFITEAIRLAEGKV